MSQEGVIYVQRPDGTALWLPELMLESLRIRRGQRLSAAQYEGEEIQGLLSRRIAAKKGRTKR